MDAEVVGLTRVAKEFHGVRILDDISLSINKSERVVLLGGSGSGKSTILRIIAGLETADSGDVRVMGVSPLTHKRIGVPVGLVSQKLNDLWEQMTVLENVSLPLQVVRHLDRSDALECAWQALRSVNIDHRAHAKPNELSGGEYQRAKLARSLATAPKVLLLDEITSALDPEMVGEMLDVIARLAEEGRTMLIVSHELHFVRHVASRIIYLHDGHIAEDGLPVQVLHEPRCERLKEFLLRFKRWAADW